MIDNFTGVSGKAFSLTIGHNLLINTFSNQLIVKTDDDLSDSEKSSCCDPNSISCEKVRINKDQFDQVSPEAVSLNTGLFDPANSDEYIFKQRVQRSQNTVEKIFSNGKDVLSVNSNNGRKFVDVDWTTISLFGFLDENLSIKEKTSLVYE